MPISVTFNFDFLPMIQKYLNRVPVSLFQWKEMFIIPINFEEPFENEVLLFSFTDENRHLMNISLIDGDKSKKFTQ